MLGPASIEGIYRYPVKGLSPERIEQAHLAAGETVPGDRLYAVENGPSGFDPEQPRHRAKTHYLMLMRNERLARLRTRLDPSGRMLVIERAGHDAVRGDLGTREGHAVIERFFADFC